jgi:hypothetical protein
VEGGRFVAYTVNPAFTLSKPNCTKYGVTVLREEPEEDRYACEAAFVTDPPFLVRWYRWSQATYERAIKEAGFRDFAWYPSEVAPDDSALWGSVLARFLRQLPRDRAGLPEVTWGALPPAEDPHPWEPALWPRAGVTEATLPVCSRCAARTARKRRPMEMHDILL